MWLASLPAIRACFWMYFSGGHQRADVRSSIGGRSVKDGVDFFWQAFGTARSGLGKGFRPASCDTQLKSCS